MDHAAYAVEAQLEETHWWFVERRRLFASIIEREGVPRNADVVDIGTGTGANLRLLRHLGFANVTGIDPTADAAHWCAQKGLGQVRKDDIRSLPLQDQSVDFVLATDVVEHVGQDDVALSEIYRILRPGGIAL